MTETTTPDLDSTYDELEQVREALRSPKIGLMRTKALYRRLSELHAIIDKLEACEHAA